MCWPCGLVDSMHATTGGVVSTQCFKALVHWTSPNTSVKHASIVSVPRPPLLEYVHDTSPLASVVQPALTAHSPGSLASPTLGPETTLKSTRTSATGFPPASSVAVTVCDVPPSFVASAGASVIVGTRTQVPFGASSTLMLSEKRTSADRIVSTIEPSVLWNKGPHSRSSSRPLTVENCPTRLAGTSGSSCMIFPSPLVPANRLPSSPMASPLLRHPSNPDPCAKGQSPAVSDSKSI